MKLFGLVGAGGFGREVMPVVMEYLQRNQSASEFEAVFVVEHQNTAPVNGHRVLSIEAFLQSEHEKYFNIAISNSGIREQRARECLAAGAKPLTISASNSLSLSHNQIAPGAILCPFTTITANASIGAFFHANLYSYVAHDCQIGDFVTFAPYVQCNGGVIIEDHAYIGTGAILKQGTQDKPIIIGQGAIVGMGAVVTKSVAPYTTVVGNPAAPLVKKSG